MISLVMSWYFFCLMLVRALESLEYIRISFALCFATTAAKSMSPRKAVTSLMMFAPASRAASATSALYVSTEILILLF